MAGAVRLTVCLCWIFAATTALDSSHLLAELHPPGLSQGANFGTAVAVSDELIAIGAFNDQNETGRAFVYRLQDDKVVLMRTLQPERLTRGSNFACSLALSATALAIGAQYDGDRKEGAVYVYSTSNLTQDPVKLSTSEPLPPKAFFGSSMSLSAHFLAVGSAGGSGLGRVFIFRESSGQWNQVAVIDDPSGQPGNNFGQAVSLTVSDQTAAIVIGCNHADNLVGAAFVTTLDLETGVPTQPLFKVSAPSQLSAGSYFGSSCLALPVEEHQNAKSIVFAVGAPFADNANGSLAVFEMNGTAPPALVQQLVGAAGVGAGFATSMTSIHDRGETLLAVGSWQERPGGSVRMYRLEHGSHVGNVKRVLLPEERNAFFGSAVSGLNQIVVVGADGSHNDEGSAFVFKLESEVSTPASRELQV